MEGRLTNLRRYDYRAHKMYPFWVYTEDSNDPHHRRLFVFPIPLGPRHSDAPNLIGYHHRHR
jgi:hypothetical protein